MQTPCAHLILGFFEPSTGSLIVAGLLSLISFAAFLRMKLG
jgi:hypothetical protein